MKAFHNDKAVKKKYIARVLEHQKADQVMRGRYWDKQPDGVFRGCAVGCTLHSGEHQAYETELGIPEWLARLEDYLFENMATGYKTWPHRFLRAIPVGFDNWDYVWHKFSIYLLLEDEEAAIKHADEDAHQVQAIAALHQAAIDDPEGDRSAACLAAWSAAWSAARSAERSAAWLAAWSAARSGARSAARSAERSAAWLAAWSAAESAAAKRQADYLLTLFKQG